MSGSGEGSQKPNRKKKATPKLKPSDTLPQWNVILCNDEVNSPDDVKYRVQEIMHFDQQIAEQKVREAHEKGKSLLATTNIEKAELLADRFGVYKITIDISPAK